MMGSQRADTEQPLPAVKIWRHPRHSQTFIARTTLIREVPPLRCHGTLLFPTPIIFAAFLLAASIVLMSTGCLQIEGGAVEVSWVTYCASGKRPGIPGASCSCTVRARDLSTVKLVLAPIGVASSDGGTFAIQDASLEGGDGCAQGAQCLFRASDNSGITGFRIPPGDYAMWIVPLDANALPLGGPSCVPDGSTLSCWQTPSPIRRTVVRGEVISLGTMLIAIPDCPALAGCRPSEGCP